MDTQDWLCQNCQHRWERNDGTDSPACPECGAANADGYTTSRSKTTNMDDNTRLFEAIIQVVITANNGGVFTFGEIQEQIETLLVPWRHLGLDVRMDLSGVTWNDAQQAKSMIDLTDAHDQMPTMHDVLEFLNQVSERRAGFAAEVAQPWNADEHRN